MARRPHSRGSGDWPDLLTLPAAPAFTRHLRRNPGLGQSGNQQVADGSGLVPRPLPAPGPAEAPPPPRQEMVFRGILTWGRRLCQGPGPPRGSPPPASGALARQRPGSPPPKHTARAASNFSTFPDKVQREKEARAKGIRAGEKTNTRPHSDSFCLKAVQKPDVCVSQDSLCTRGRLACMAWAPLSFPRHTHTRTRGLPRGSPAAPDPSQRLPCYLRLHHCVGKAQSWGQAQGAGESPRDCPRPWARHPERGR